MMKRCIYKLLKVEVIPEEPKEINEMMKMDLTMSGSKTVQIVI